MDQKIDTGQPETTWRTVDRIIRQRHEGGSDWGTERFVLVRQVRNGGLRELVWWQSHKAWSGRMSGYQHTPARLLTISYKGASTLSATDTWKVIHEGGRLSRAVISQHADAINRFFDEPVADQIEVKRTLVNSAMDQGRGQ
jgi:hypothetical protein